MPKRAVEASLLSVRPGPPRLAVLALTAAVAVLLAGCGADDGGAAADDGGGAEVDVVATMSIFADFAEAVGGDRVDVTTLVPVGGDPHTYEPRPSDSRALAEADVVLDNGLGLSPWFEPLADGVDGRLVVLTEGIEDEVREQEGKIDPHMWMVPEYAMAYVDAIEAALVEVDPEGDDLYAERAEAYRAELAALDEELAARFATIPEHRRKLVTSHDAYSYFAERYGLEVVGTVLGVSTEEEPSAGAVARLVDAVQAEGVPTVFLESTINPALVERVARDAGVEVGDPLYGDSVGPPGSGADDYLGMMRANADAIVVGLGGARS